MTPIGFSNGEHSRVTDYIGNYDIPLPKPKLENSVRQSRTSSMIKQSGSMCADFSHEIDQETRDLCNHMLAHIQLHLGNYISQLENEKPKRFQKKLNIERIGLLKYISEKI